MAATTSEVPNQAGDRKLVVNIPEELLTSLRTHCAEKTSVSLLGRLQGKHPGLKALTAWARDTLHPSFTFLSMIAKNVFEVTFDNPEGRIHALTQTDLTCESSTISFSSWKPHFAKTTRVEDQLDFPVWVQIVDLCQILREEKFLRTVGEQIGQVIAIDNSEAYRAKLFGPRIRLLISDLSTIPHTVILPRLDGEGVVEYALEYSGLPNQCGRCRSKDHQVRHCPKIRRREQMPNNAAEAEPVRKLNLETNIREHITSEEPTEQQNNTTTPIIATSIPDPATPVLPSPECNNIFPAELQPNDHNFPQLTSPTPGTSRHTPREQETTPTFVWSSKQIAECQATGKGKEPAQTPRPESAPITRQGYRSGRLADDFWAVIGVPGTPQSQKKKLRAIPFITKNQRNEEYLAENKVRNRELIPPVQIA
jgi:hypothetical protein